MNASPSPGTITQSLRLWNRGEESAANNLMPVVYEELRSMAQKLFLGERRERVLQPTALVHETYLRMLDVRHPNWIDRAHFFAAAATMMRRILVDEARKRNAARRAAPWIQVDLAEAEHAPALHDFDYIAVDESLNALEALDPPLARVAELRFLAGLTNEETAEVMQRSISTVKRDWSAARAFLLHRLSQ